MTLASHRLPDAAFRAYSKKEYHGEQPPRASNACWHVTGRNLVVVGYNDDANDALRAATGGDPKLEIPWCSMDTVAHIMQRLEENLLIPRAHWVLATEGRLLPRALVACNSIAFSTLNPELVLVPQTDMVDYQKSARSVPRTAVDIAKALFGLVEPLGYEDARSWAAYVKQRRYLNTRLQELVVHGLDDYNTEFSEGGMLEQIRLNTSRVLSSIKGIRGSVLESAQYAITPWELRVQETETGVGKVEMVTRIHSLHLPAAVDVKVDSWERKVWYRVLDPVPAENALKDARGGSWKVLFAWDLRLMHAHKGYRGPDERFDMAGFEVQDVKSLLYGDAIDISLVDMGRLLLAAIGVYISLRVPDDDYVEETPDGRYQSNEGDGNQDRLAFLSDELRYDFPSAEWLGFHIRRACNAPLPSDLEFGRKAPVSHRPEADGDMDAYELAAMNY